MSLDEYLQELSSKSLMNNYAVRPSPIHGNGVFSQKPFRKGDFINTHFKAGEEITDFGKHLNHSPNPNARSIKQDDGSYNTYAEKDIKPNDEITLDYTVNKDLEQPESNWNLTEKVIVREPPEGSDEIEIQVDNSDEANISFSPNSKPKNARTNEGGADTVFGQGTNPKPEDETYLSLLKKSTKVQVKMKEEDEEDKDEIEVDLHGHNNLKPNPDLNPSFYGSDTKKSSFNSN